MSVTLKRLAGPVKVATGGVAVYTVPASTVAQVKSVRLTNMHTATVNARVHLLAVGASALDENCISGKLALPAGESVPDEIGPLPMAAGEKLHIVVDVTNVVSVLALGAEEPE